MGFFGGYENAGPGINPNAPKKAPFFRFWELLWRNLGKILTLNLIYTCYHAPLLFSLIVFMETSNKLTIPFTIALLVLQLLLEGPIIAGCTKALRLIVLDKPCAVYDEFKEGFSKNFGISFLTVLIDTLIAASVYSGFHIYPMLAEQSDSKLFYVAFGLNIAVGLIVLFMNFYILPLQVATKLSKKSVFKNAFMLAFLSPKACFITLGGTVLMLAIAVGLMLISGYLMFLLAFFPAAFIGYLVMFVNYPVIQKYVIRPYYEETGEPNPEEDEIIPEEERIFTDRGGTETPVKKSKNKGKTLS